MFRFKDINESLKDDSWFQVHLLEWMMIPFAEPGNISTELYLWEKTITQAWIC